MITWQCIPNVQVEKRGMQTHTTFRMPLFKTKVLIKDFIEGVFLNKKSVNIDSKRRHYNPLGQQGIARGEK